MTLSVFGSCILAVFGVAAAAELPDLSLSCAEKGFWIFRTDWLVIGEGVVWRKGEKATVRFH